MTVSVHPVCPVSWLSIEPRHPALPGHFPGKPIVPGVVLLDHVLAFARESFQPRASASRIPWVKFLEPLLPEQQVMLGLDAVKQEEIRFTCRIGPSCVAEGVLVLSRTSPHE